jgi:hypothetical protein
MGFQDFQPSIRQFVPRQAQERFADFAPSGTGVRTTLARPVPLALFAKSGSAWDKRSGIELWAQTGVTDIAEEEEQEEDSWADMTGSHRAFAAQHGASHHVGGLFSERRPNELGWTASRLTFKAAMGSSTHVTTTSIQGISSSLFGAGSVLPIDVLAGGLAIGVDVAFFGAQLIAGKAAKHQFARRASRSTIMIGSASAAKLLLAAPVTTAVISSGLIGSSVPVGLLGLVSVGTVMTAGVGLVVAAGIGASFAIFDFMRGRAMKDQDFDIRIEVVIVRLMLHKDAAIPLPAR